MTRMTSSIIATALVLGACLGATGCLEADIQQTIYIEADGSVVSEIVGLNIRSDSNDPEQRLKEEREFLEELGDGIYEQELFPPGATRVRTTLFRDEPPYTVLMTARYPRVDEFFAETFEFWHEVDVPEARLEYLGDVTRLVLAYPAYEEDPEDRAEACLKAWDDFGYDPASDDFFIRIILTEGRFVESEGFEIDDDLAIPQPAECVAVRDGLRTYSLTWKTE